MLIERGLLNSFRHRFYYIHICILKGKYKQNKWVKVLLKLFRIWSSVSLNHFVTQSLVGICSFPHHLVLGATQWVCDAAILGRALSTLVSEAVSQPAHSANFDAGIKRKYSLFFFNFIVYTLQLSPPPSLRPSPHCVRRSCIHVLWLILSPSFKQSLLPPVLWELSVCAVYPWLWFYFVCFVH